MNENYFDYGLKYNMFVFNSWLKIILLFLPDSCSSYILPVHLNNSYLFFKVYMFISLSLDTIPQKVSTHLFTH